MQRSGENEMPNRVPIRLLGKRSKYGAVKTVVDGITFDSKKEAARYQELKLLKVEALVLQPEYELRVNGELICKYRADFRYMDKKNGLWIPVIEDCKGVKTAVYRLKKKLMLACYGIHILET
jgi:hypothetical protein